MIVKSFCLLRYLTNTSKSVSSIECGRFKATCTNYYSLSAKCKCSLSWVYLYVVCGETLPSIFIVDHWMFTYQV